MKGRIGTQWKRVAEAWNSFWFSPQDALPLAIFKLFFGSGAAIFYVIRMTDYSYYFGETGILPYSILDGVIPTLFFSPIPWEWFARDPGIGLFLHGALVAGLLALGFGWIDRKGAWIVFVLHLVFMKRNPLIVYGADMIATFWLFYLCFARTSHSFRIPLPGLLEGRWGTRKAETDFFSTVGLRLIQVQLMLVYAYSGIEKLRGQTWWQGDAIWNTLSNGQVVSWDFGFLVHVPELIAGLTFFTVLWEIYFPFLMWIKPIRKGVLAFGLVFHAGIGVMMNIPGFSFFMMASYWVFVDASVLRSQLKRFARRRLAPARMPG